MYVKRLLNTDSGIAFISVLLGLGLATLFRRVCTDKNCIVFKGPVISEIRDHVYKYNDKCYKYEENPTSCDNTKKIIEIDSTDKVKQAFVSDIYGPSNIYGNRNSKYPPPQFLRDRKYLKRDVF